MAEPFHFPPDLFGELVQAIALICRTKPDVLLFFQSCGVSNDDLADLRLRVAADRAGISKYEICRVALTRINEAGDRTLRQRREVIRRVTSFEDYSACWDDDRLKAKGAVAEVSRLVNVKDTFTRLAEEREEERRARQGPHRAAAEEKVLRREALGKLRDDLYAVFSEKNHAKRGTLLESALNRIFRFYGLSVRESFTLTADNARGVVEQIDAVIDIDGEVYLVEIKWRADRLGPLETNQHLVRIFSRGQARGILVSGSGFTEAAVSAAKDALHRCVVVLCDLEEIVAVVGEEGDLKEMLRAKIREAIIAKNPCTGSTARANF